LWTYVSTAAEEVIWVVCVLAALANDDALVTEVSRRVVSFRSTASGVSSTRTRVEVVLTADVLQGIVGFLKALGEDVFIEAKVPV